MNALPHHYITGECMNAMATCFCDVFKYIKILLLDEFAHNNPSFVPIGFISILSAKTI